MYKPPRIDSGPGIARSLKKLPGRVLVVTMDLPWQVLQRQMSWQPTFVHMVPNMERDTVLNAAEHLPPCDVVVGVGGGSSMDTAKYIAWKRGCRMILAPTIISVDAPFTNTIAVRVDKTVQYIGNIYPEELLIDYSLIQLAPKELNRAGACDIASIHTALYDWELARDLNDEAFDDRVARLARECLNELDKNAEEIYNVTPKGIDTIVDIYRREVEMCSWVKSSRPEEGSEHIVAYSLEHQTGRHFIHGDLVGLGIFMMSRLQSNGHSWIVDLMRRVGLRYRCDDASPAEIRECLMTLTYFKEFAKLFYSVLDTVTITPEFIDDALAALYVEALS